MGQFSLIRSQNCTPFVFLDSLLYKECYEKILEVFLTRSTRWGISSLGSVFRNNIKGTLHCFGQFSLIRSRNCTPFVLLDILLYEECFEKILELFSTSSTSWGTGLIGSTSSTRQPQF